MKKKIMIFLIQVIFVLVVVNIINGVIDSYKNQSFQEECEHRLGKLETLPLGYRVGNTQIDGRIYVCRGKD